MSHRDPDNTKTRADQETRGDQDPRRVEGSGILGMFTGPHGPNWRRIVGTLAILAALVVLIKHWNRDRTVELTLVVLQQAPVRSITIQLFDKASHGDAGPLREVRLEGTPGSQGRTFSLPAGRYRLVLRTEKLDGRIERTERTVALSGDAELTLQIR